MFDSDLSIFLERASKLLSYAKKEFNQKKTIDQGTVWNNKITNKT